VPLSEGWDAVSAVAACPTLHWESHVWRIHSQKYSATDPGGSLRASGRYHCGLDQFPEDRVFPTLYLATSAEIAVAELVRHVTPEVLPTLNNHRLSEIFARLERVLDCRDPAPLDLSLTDLLHDTDLRSRGASGQPPLL
jgi:RES domain-containing protein